jgi:hypothetical protein
MIAGLWGITTNADRAAEQALAVDRVAAREIEGILALSYAARLGGS